MLRVLGGLFYFFAVIAALAAVVSLGDSGFSAAVAFASAISSAFFGAMCFAAAEAIELLRRIAGLGPSGLGTDDDEGLSRLQNGVLIGAGLIALVLVLVVLF